MASTLTPVLFDLDGTLLDSYTLIFESFRHACRVVLNRELTEGDVLERWGSPLRARFERIDRTRTDELINAYVAYYDAHHKRVAALFPGVLEMLDTLKRRGCRLGIVTSKRRRTTARAIQDFDLDRYVVAVVSEQDVRAPKPAAEPVLAALERLGGQPEKAFMVGDAAFDVQAARGAGVRSIAALWGTRDLDALLAAGPDYAAASPPDVVTVVESGGCRRPTS
ncbi:MAG: HAD family hydrolase [Armatimonadota bacterium]